MKRHVSVGLIWATLAVVLAVTSTLDAQPAAQMNLGAVRIPRAVRADGKALPAGTYQVRLTPEEARRSKVDDHDRRILAALAEEPMSANGLLNSGRVRVNRRDLYTATTRLVESGRLARGPKGTLQLTGEVFQVFQNDRTPCVVRGRAKRRCSTCSRACEARTGNTFRAARKIDCRHRGDPVTRTATCLR